MIVMIEESKCTTVDLKTSHQCFMQHPNVNFRYPLQP